MPSSLDAVIKNALEKKIGEQVWDILKDQIEEDIYGKKPSGEWSFSSQQDGAGGTYKRRKETGLLDESKKYIQADRTGGNTWRLRVSTLADPAPSVLGYTWVPSIGGFLALLEKGDLGFVTTRYKNGHLATWAFPRPVISHAQWKANENKGKYTAELYEAINKAISKKKKK